MKGTHVSVIIMLLEIIAMLGIGLAIVVGIFHVINEATDGKAAAYVDERWNSWKVKIDERLDRDFG